LVDWGDSCVTHPFASLFVTYELAVNRFARTERSAAALRLRDAYLEVWSPHSSPATLQETFTLAVWVGYVTRALEFAHMLQGADSGMIARWQAHIVVLLGHWAKAHALLDESEHFLSAIEPWMLMPSPNGGRHRLARLPPAARHGSIVLPSDEIRRHG
jgi:hypothetical protein